MTQYPREITEEEIAFDEAVRKAEEELRPLLTPEFLSTLLIAIETVGWAVDVHETDKFAIKVFSIAGLTLPRTLKHVGD